MLLCNVMLVWFRMYTYMYMYYQYDIYILQLWPKFKTALLQQSVHYIITIFIRVGQGGICPTSLENFCPPPWYFNLKHNFMKGYCHGYNSMISVTPRLHHNVLPF